MDDRGRPDSVASWDSVVNVQYLAYVDPAAAWNAFTRFLSWFWATPTSQPVQQYQPATGNRYSGVDVTVTSALAVPTLSGQQLAAMFARFDSRYDAAAPLAGFGKVTSPAVTNIDVRFGITSYTIYGLLAHGRATQARLMSNAILRDIVSSGMFAERYEWSATAPPYGSGQRPSIFGAATVVDTVLMNNGVRVDSGLPAVVSFGDAAGGVDNLVVRGHTLHVAWDPAASRATQGGTLIADTPGCDTVAVAPGTTVALPPACLVA